MMGMPGRGKTCGAMISLLDGGKAAPGSGIRRLPMVPPPRFGSACFVRRDARGRPQTLCPEPEGEE